MIQMIADGDGSKLPLLKVQRMAKMAQRDQNAPSSPNVSHINDIFLCLCVPLTTNNLLSSLDVQNLNINNSTHFFSRRFIFSFLDLLSSHLQTLPHHTLHNPVK